MREKQRRANQSAFSFLTGNKDKALNVEGEIEEDDESNARALQLTGRRLKATKRENELLYFSISGGYSKNESVERISIRCACLLPPERSMIVAEVFVVSASTRSCGS